MSGYVRGLNYNTFRGFPFILCKGDNFCVFPYFHLMVLLFQVPEFALYNHLS